MNSKQFKIESGILSTREKLKDRFLFAAKITKPETDNFIFYIIEILSPWFPSTKVEEAITSILKRSFLNKEDFSSDDFENVLSTVNAELGNLSSQGETDWIGNLNSIIGYSQNKSIHLTMIGTVPAFLISGGKVSNISDGLCAKGETHPLKTFANITSGGLNENDKILIGNIRFYDHISIDRLRRLIERKDPKEALLEAYRVLKRGKIKDASAIFMQLVDSEKNPNEKEELADTIYLDQNEESSLSKIYKKTSPHIAVAGKSFLSMLMKVKDGSRKTAKVSSRKLSELHKKYSPETKKAIENTSQSIKSQTTKFLGSVKKSKGFNVSGIKIRSYMNENKIKQNAFLSTSAKIIKKIFARENRRYLYASLVLILLLFGYFKIKSNNESRVVVSRQHDIIASVDEARKLFNEAREDIGLGKDEGKEKLIKALNIAKTGEQLEASKEESISLRKEIQTKIDELIKAKSFYSLKPIFTLNSPKVGILVGTAIYSINEDGKIYLTETKEGEPALISSINSDYGKVKKLAFSDSQNAIYILTDTDKVLLLDLKNQVVSEQKIDSGETFTGATSLGAYSTNLYLLNPSNGRIIKYAKTNTGFTKGSNYNNAGVESIKNGIDLAIDGSVFILNNDGTVKKFLRGVLSSDFSLKEIPSPGEAMSEVSQISADADSNYIYILDKKLNRVIKFDENSGTYSSQYSFPEFTVDQFYINPRIQKMWLLSENNVYEVDL